jgi:ABC-type taurine transport system ATPase subunit
LPVNGFFHDSIPAGKTVIQELGAQHDFAVTVSDDAALFTELNRIWRETGTTILLVTHSIAEAVFLGTRVEVMSPRPGSLVRTFGVALPADRNYAQAMTDPEFGTLTHQIRALLGSNDRQHGSERQPAPG